VLHLYRELWRLIRGERRMFLGAVGLLIAAQVVLLAVPYISGRAINTLQLKGWAGMREAGVWLLMMLVVAAASWILHGPARVLERNVALSVRRRMSATLIERLFSLPLAWHESHHSGATTHRVQQSTHALSGFAQSQFIYLNSAVRLVGPLFALSVIEPLVGLAAALGFVLMSLSVIGFDRAMIRLAHQENDAERLYASTLVDTLGNTTSLFALRQARSLGALLERRLMAVFEPLKRAILLNEAKWCAVDLATRALSCGLVALFAWLASREPSGATGAQKTLLLGSIYMVWEYAQQAGGVISAVASHFQTFARQNADYASADIIREAVPAYDRSSGTPVGSTAWRRLDIRELSFRHSVSRGEAPTLDRLSFSLERGKRYALIGGSGSGKSTLLRVLAGLYPSERIVLERAGAPVIVSSAQAAHFLRATTTLIPQDAEVCEGTLAENLALAESVTGPPSPDEYPRALELARATDFVQATPDGLQIRVAERAVNWSGGQRSRIALARGVLAAAGSGLVLLDEPTASLDPVTEAHVYTNLFAAFDDACVVSSIHRLNLLDRFDEILVMRDGRLTAQGPLDELALTSPEFQELMSAHRQYGSGAAEAADSAQSPNSAAAA
jgi:ABC-type multidrug transport system fused ATPase/permease subunit